MFSEFNDFADLQCELNVKKKHFSFSTEYVIVTTCSISVYQITLKFSPSAIDGK